MKTSTLSLNPFSLMMEPELVLQAMEASDALRRLDRRTLRPLDKPLIPLASPASKNREQAAFDAAIDQDDLDHWVDDYLLN